jgi:SAM-dependent methyltransferase
MATSAHNQEAYDRWSAFYDEYPNPTVAIDDLAFPPFWRGLTGGQVLEVGCGTGRHTRRLLDQGNRVTGVDLSPGMLGVARRRLEGSDVELIHADVLAYEGFAPASFDAAVSALVIEHIADLEGLFGLLSSVLRPGGRFYLSEIHPDRTAQGIAAHFVDRENGEEVRLQSYPHADAAIRQAAERSGLRLEATETILGDERLARLNPKWERYLGAPMIQVWVFGKRSG